MANDCTNVLTIKGPKLDVDILETIFRQKNPLDYLMPLPSKLFDMIEDVRKNAPPRGEVDTWDDMFPPWRVWVEYNWGTKWIVIDSVQRKSETVLEVRLDTANRPLRGAIDLLGRMFRDARFDLKFFEPNAGYRGQFLLEKAQVRLDTTVGWDVETPFYRAERIASFLVSIWMWITDKLWFPSLLWRMIARELQSARIGKPSEEQSLVQEPNEAEVETNDR